MSTGEALLWYALGSVLGVGLGVVLAEPREVVWDLRNAFWDVYRVMRRW